MRENHLSGRKCWCPGLNPELADSRVPPQLLFQVVSFWTPLRFPSPLLPAPSTHPMRLPAGLPPADCRLWHILLPAKLPFFREVFSGWRTYCSLSLF